MSSRLLRVMLETDRAEAAKRARLSKSIASKVIPGELMLLPKTVSTGELPGNRWYGVALCMAGY